MHGVNSDVQGQLNIKTENDGAPVWTGEYVGFIRLLAGYDSKRDSTTYGLIYLVLVIDTCVFTFMYLRRVLYMAFLTMIAPLIALTYPLDRIKDGKAQAFSMWLREYIFNALIQPVHLIIYTMIVSTVIKLAVNHPVYALVALGFIMPAEKFIRQMFGFGNASTLNPLGAFAGGALVMQMVNNLSRLGRGAAKGKGDDKGKDKDKVRTKDKNTPDLPEVEFGGGNNSTVAVGSSGGRGTNGGSGAPQTQDGNSGGVRTNDRAVQDGSVSGENGNQGVLQTNRPGAPAASGGSGNSGNRNNPSMKAKFANAMASIGNRGKNRILKAKPLKFLGRLTAMKMGALTVGTLGLAAGISSGDFKNVLGYTAAGATTGALVGKSLADRGMNKVSEVKEDFKEGFKGKEKYNNEKLDQEYFNGRGFQEMLDNHSLLPNLSGRERAQELRQQIETYRSSGITDNDQIAQCMKAGLSADVGAQALRTASQIKGMNLDSKGKKEYEAAWKKQIGSSFGKTKADKIWEIIEANM